jgi:coenzyme F420-0:L-glutamate ligase / coenzyme F420-1:gamma-L-glutamate ligase
VFPGDSPGFCAYALPHVPIIEPGDDLVAIILDVLRASDIDLRSGDVLVISSKIVSKAEGRFVTLADVQPGDEALRVAEITGKDPRLVEIVLRESTQVSRVAKGVLITEHRLGFVSANSGVDQSNVDSSHARALLLPADPDGSAERIRQALENASNVSIGVVISDTHGRPFRLGNVGVAIGASGFQALVDHRGERDLFGRELVATVIGYGDMLASAAHLVTGEGAEGLPLVLIRGLHLPPGDGHASDLNRTRQQDLYR